LNNSFVPTWTQMATNTGMWSAAITNFHYF